MLRIEAGHRYIIKVESSAFDPVARLYRDIVSVFVLDERDAAHAPRIADLGMRPVITDTIMSSPGRSRALAGCVMRELAK